MTNETTKPGTAVAALKPIDPLAPKTSRPAFLAICRNGLIVEMGEARIFADRAPTPAQRSILEARIGELSRLLGHRDDAAAFAKLALVLTLPSQSATGVDAKVRGMAYREALDDIPAWAIVEVCRRLLRNGYPQHSRFAPSPPEMRGLCDELVAPLRAEIGEHRDILRARVVPAPNHNRPISPIAKTWAEVEAERRGKSSPIASWATPNILADLERRRQAREAGPAKDEDAA
jgi:hypothetical protein